MVGGAQRPEEQEYMREIQEKAIQLGIGERVRFLGQRSDVPSLLAAADIFSQPNLGAEPFGIVFIEALAAGLPVVTTAMGGPQEIIDESCGFVAPPGDAESSGGVFAASRSIRPNCVRGWASMDPSAPASYAIPAGASPIFTRALRAWSAINRALCTLPGSSSPPVSIKRVGWIKPISRWPIIC